MKEEIESYFGRLASLSTLELERSAQRVVNTEKRHVAQVIAHIAEISKRKAHIELGYRTLFDYCVRGLGLSEGSAWSRIQIANVARRFPQVFEHLAGGKVSPSVLALLSPKLTEENVERLLSDSEGKTKRETKEYLAALDPQPTFEPTVRRKPARAEEKLEVGGGDLEEASRSSPATGGRAPSETSSSAASLGPKPEGTLEPARPDVFNFRFSANRNFREKLSRLGEVLGIANPEKRMAEVFEQALDLALDKKDPKRKLGAPGQAWERGKLCRAT